MKIRNMSVKYSISKILVLLLFLCSKVAVMAQLQGYEYMVLPTLSKLPVNAIHRICFDTEGYIWYGTVDGLCRDDGYSIHTFRNNFLTPELIQMNHITGITEDKHHRIWFCTRKGIYVLDKSNYDIKPVDVPELKDAKFDNIVGGKDGYVYAQCFNVVYKIGIDDLSVRKYVLPGYINDIMEDSQGRVFTSVSPMGVCMLKPNAKDFVMVCDSVRAMSVNEDNSRKFMWVMCYDQKIYKLYFGKRTVMVPQTIVGIEGNNTQFFEMVQDNVNHYLWQRTNHGLIVLKQEGGNILRSMSTIGLIPQRNMLLSRVCKDLRGNIWVASFDAPSFYVHYRHNMLMNYVSSIMEQRTNYLPAVVTLCRDDGGYVWYYQEGNGVYFTDPNATKVVSYKDCPETKGAALWRVPYLIRSKRKNSIWATAYTKVYLVQREGETMVLRKTIDLEKHTAKTGEVECVYEDRSGNLWISTMKGLYIWKAASGKIVALDENIGRISDFVQTADGVMWATVRNKGICRIDAGYRMKMYPHNDDFNSLDATSNGHLWIGTGEGRVFEFVPTESDSLKDRTLACGMQGDMVSHIAIDNLNHVWIVANQRVCEFNPRNGALRVLKTNDDNVPLKRFLPFAVYYDSPTNTMYLGGIPGFITLQPSKALESIPKRIQVKISDVTVGGQSVWLASERRTDANSIDIKPDETNISIHFTTLDYVNRKHINYSYRLIGVDKDWIYLTEENNVANYNRLSKGTYTLEVRATDENGLWSDEVTRFTINRLPAWYETWYAYTLYILVLSIVIGVLVRLYFSWHKEKQEREMIENLLKAKQMQIEEEQRAAAANKGKETPAVSAETPSHQEPAVTPVRSFDEEFLAKAAHIVEQNLANPELNVVFLASELGMSRSTFMRRIKAVTGQTPLDYIKSVKLKHAYAMLQDKTATIQDVMKAIGYSDRKTFTQSFKEAFNITPSEHQHKG